MSYTYPSPAPNINGDVLTISTFLKNPALVARRIRDLANERFIADAILTGRYEVVGGAIQYEQGESLYSDRPPKAIAPGGEYPLTSIGGGQSQIAKAEKWGQDSLVTDEAIVRQKMDPVNRGMTKQVNQMVKTVDSISLAAISSQVTQTIAATAAWDTSGSMILRDVLTTVAKITALNEGFVPDTLVVDDLTFAIVASDEKIAAMRAREDTSNPVYSGSFPIVGGLRMLPTPNLGMAKTAFVLDSTQLGGMADEKLGGPGYHSAGGVGVEAKTIRDEDNDQWKIRARRVTVPVVVEPKAAYKITGVLS
ncbi:phage major capsid protein [Prescottella equi]|uniref:phage major capsid protein n=1 Tax=Rhodococcus hoagii TaxID=43767 RepID=UPI0007CD5B80|nr:hypothetical protein [Prescottella equi]ORL01559.1 hypothetical protein A6F56_04365 [Prescottella equi]